MVAVAESFVETFDVANEHLTLPLFCCILWVSVVVEEESELHSTSVENTLVALSRDILASCVTEDSESKNRWADGIEAGAVANQWFSARCHILDLSIRQTLQSPQLVVEVLHWRLNDATFSTDWLVAEVVELEIHSIYGSCVVDDVTLKVPKHVEVWALEHVEFKIIVKRGNPAGIDAEEESKLLSEVSLLYVCAWVCWHPEFLWIGLK